MKTSHYVLVGTPISVLLYVIGAALGSSGGWLWWHPFGAVGLASSFMIGFGFNVVSNWHQKISQIRASQITYDEAEVIAAIRKLTEK